MNYFVIQVQTRKEEEFLTYIKKELIEPDTLVFLPRRKLRIRRKGEWMEIISPIFPGYVFLKTGTITPSVYKAIKRKPGFIRFLQNNYNVTPLTDKDKKIINHFLGFGEIVGISDIRLAANKKVKVISGPLKGLEGNIIRVNKRKKRIRVKISFNNILYPIDFSYESLGSVEEND